jgi:quercetin dioxygenase-like cupin family protein
VRRALAAALCAAGIVWLGGSRPAGQQATAPAVAVPEGRQEPEVHVPVHQDPHHRQVFQYGPTRILDLRIPPGDISWFHTHEWPVLYVTFERSQIRTQSLGLDWGARAGGRGAAAGRGGPSADAPPAASAAPRATSTVSYVETPVTHRIQNIGGGLFWASVVINETQGDDTTAAQAAGFSGRPELTNNWFRAYRIVLSPGERTATHKHRAPVAIIQATPGKAVAVGPAKWELNQQSQWAFFDAGDSHDFRNTGESAIELIEVELRRK